MENKHTHTHTHAYISLTLCNWLIILLSTFVCCLDTENPVVEEGVGREDVGGYDKLLLLLLDFIWTDRFKPIIGCDIEHDFNPTISDIVAVDTGKDDETLSVTIVDVCIVELGSNDLLVSVNSFNWLANISRSSMTHVNWACIFDKIVSYFIHWKRNE